MAWWTQPPSRAEAKRAAATARGDVIAAEEAAALGDEGNTADDRSENDERPCPPVPLLSRPPPPLANLHAPVASPETTAAAARNGTASADVYASSPAADSPGGGARCLSRARYHAVKPAFASTAAQPNARPELRASVSAASAAPAAITPDASTACLGGALPSATRSAAIDAAAERRRSVMKRGTERAPVPARAVTTPACYCFLRRGRGARDRGGESFFLFSLRRTPREREQKNENSPR